MAYANAIRAARKGGLEVGTTFKSYVSEYPLHPDFLVLILDLADCGVDLSWYPRPTALIRLDGSSVSPLGEVEVKATMSIVEDASADPPTAEDLIVEEKAAAANVEDVGVDPA
ncbi:hypothetical protein OROGR_021036 [Orobanche gracilis]